MSKILKLAIRNISRDKKRNISLAVAIAFGFFIVTVIECFVAGIMENVKNASTQMFGGSVFITGVEQKISDSENNNIKYNYIIEDGKYLPELLKKTSIDFESYTGYTRVQSYLIFNGNKNITVVYGRDFTEEKFLDSFDFIEGGKENASDSKCLFISDRDAKSLNVKIGDVVVCKSVPVFGYENVVDLVVGGIYKTKSYVDSGTTYAPISIINELANMPENSYTDFVVDIKNLKKQDDVATMLEQTIREDGKNVTSRDLAMKISPKNVSNGLMAQYSDKNEKWDGTKYVVSSLNDRSAENKAYFETIDKIVTLVLTVILLIVMVGVSNTYRMVMYERFSEIGTMRALGMNRKDIKRIFTWEAVILCLIGATSGVILAAICIGIVSLIPINAESLIYYTSKGHLVFSMALKPLIIQYVILVVLTILAVRGTAKRASKLNPAEALVTVK